MQGIPHDNLRDSKPCLCAASPGAAEGEGPGRGSATLRECAVSILAVTAPQFRSFPPIQKSLGLDSALSTSWALLSRAGWGWGSSHFLFPVKGPWRGFPPLPLFLGLSPMLYSHLRLKVHIVRRN